MIRAIELTKTFDGTNAVDHINCEIPSGCTYGLVGTNGSGKSTLLRLIAGVYYPDGGSIDIDGKKIFDNSDVKSQMFFLPDNPYFFHQSNTVDMAKFYAGVYKNFDEELYNKLLTVFTINPKKNISSLSKGMQRQVAFLLAFACKPGLLLLDEAFDGLDPLILKTLKSLISDYVSEYQMTFIIASHNLRELETLCDHIGLMHGGKLLLNHNIDYLKQNIHNVNVVCNVPNDELIARGIDILQVKQEQGELRNLIVRGDGDDIKNKLEVIYPKYLAINAPTLEEIFIYTTEVSDYDFSKIIV